MPRTDCFREICPLPSAKDAAVHVCVPVRAPERGRVRTTLVPALFISASANWCYSATECIAGNKMLFCRRAAAPAPLRLSLCLQLSHNFAFPPIYWSITIPILLVPRCVTRYTLAPHSRGRPTRGSLCPDGFSVN